MQLTPAEIRDGFWSAGDYSRNAPAASRSPAEYAGAERLTIAGPPPGEAPLRRRWVREWCRVLPTLAGVRMLWLLSRVPQALFEAACQLPALEGLYLKASGVTDLAPLRQASRLRYLRLGSAPAVRNPELLGALGQLVVLEVENVPALRSLEPLTGLGQLEQLAVEGSMWTRQRVASVAPLGRLATLRHLRLAALRAEDERSLRALAACRRLEHLRVALWWPREDLEYLARELPAWRYGTAPAPYRIDR